MSARLSALFVFAGVLLAVGSCRKPSPRRPPAPAATTRPASPTTAPSAGSERRRQLALLLQRIEELERQLAQRKKEEKRREEQPAAPPAHSEFPVPPTVPPASQPTGTDTLRRSPSHPPTAVATRRDTESGANFPVSIRSGTGPAPRGEGRSPDEATLEGLIAAMEVRARNQPRNLELQRRLRLLYLIAGRDEEALQPIEGLSQTEQAVWRQILWALVNYSDRAHGLSEGERAGEAIRALDEARRLLMRQAPLEIRNLTFCTRIRGFGNLDAVPLDNFHPKPGQMVLLYCELDGFTTERTAEGKYRTVVRQQLELFTSRGDSVASWDFGEVEDICSSPRRDFYFFSRFTLPERLLPGRYVLKVRMTDCLGRKTAEETLAFRVD